MMKPTRTAAGLHLEPGSQPDRLPFHLHLHLYAPATPATLQFTMLDGGPQEHAPNLLKRSTSLWRRVSQRRRPETRSLYVPPREALSTENIPGAGAITRQKPSETASPVATLHNKLRKRPTEAALRPEKRSPVIAHLQRVDVACDQQQEASVPYQLQTPIPKVSILDLPYMMGTMTPSDASISEAASSPPRPPRVTAPDTPPPTPPLRTRVYPSALLNLQPFPPDPQHIHVARWDVFLTPNQAYDLVMGHNPHTGRVPSPYRPDSATAQSPASTDDSSKKWSIYSEGPDKSGKLKVHFHRSMTGTKIAELFVLLDLNGEGAAKVVGIKWDGGERTNKMMEEEAKYMVSMTCAWVLGVRLAGVGIV